MHGFFGDTETWGMLLGFLSPLVIAIIQQPRWSQSVRAVIGWVCALIVGFVTVLATGQLGDGSTLLRTLVLTLVSAQAAYAGWKKLGAAPAIERSTSPTRDVPQP